MSRTTAFLSSLLLLLSLPPGLQESFSQQTAGQLYEQALYLEEGKGDLREAIEKYQAILKQFPGERGIAAKAQLHIGLCLEKQGLKEATRAYQKVIADYPDQRQVVSEARTRLTALRRYAAEPASRKMTVKKVWQGPDVDDIGEISPDGKYISYVDWDTGHLALYDLETGKSRYVTYQGAGKPTEQYTTYAVQSRWSPDGKQIAYTWVTRDSVAEVRTVSLDLTPPRTISATDEKHIWFDVCDWSHDGKSILAVQKSADHTLELVVISVKDGATRAVRKLGGSLVWHPSFSPDGQYIVYDYPSPTKSSPHDIFVVSVNSGEERALITHAAHDYVLGWSPDGRHLLFASDRSGTPDMWVVGVANGSPLGAPRLIGSSPSQIQPAGLGFTADGSFFYCHFPTRTDVFVTVLDQVTGKISVAPQEAVNRFVGSNANPDYSPDGKYLAYVSRREPVRIRVSHYTPGRPDGNVLCVRNLETGEEKEIRPDFEGIGGPKWSPDSRSLLVTQWDSEDEGGLYRIDARSGNTDRVLTMKSSDGPFGRNWSADGASIYIVRTGVDEQTRSRRWRLVRREIESGAETELYRDSSTIATVSPSPDGRWLAFMARDGRLRVMPSTGGDPRTVYKIDQKHVRPMSLAWTADGKSILMPKLRLPRSDLKWDLWRIPVDGGTPESLGLEVYGLGQVSAHPDGRRIAFSAKGSRLTSDLAEVWVMENFLPEGGVKGEASAGPTKEGSGMRLRKVANVERTVYSQQLWLQGHISPDGKYLSCTDWETGDLAVFEVGTGQMHRLTNKGSWKDSSSYAETSVWSPDGKQIAYFWDSSNPALCVINADGSNSRVVLRDTNLVWIDAYDWSPDGSSILTLLQKKDDTRVIALVSTADGSTYQILELSSSNWRDLPVDMSFSPDGQKIVYDFRADKNVKGHDIFVHSIGDRKLVPLVTHPADDYVLGWSRDGRGILFASSRTGTYGLWAIAVEGTKARGEAWLVTPDIGVVTPVGFTRDGSLYYSPPFGNTPDVYTIEYNPSDATVVTPPVKVIKDFEGTSVHPDYSSCGKYLAYVSGHSYRKGRGGNVLCIRSLETGMTQEFRPKLPRFAFPRWSRDSRSLYLLVVDEDSKIIGIHRLDTRDGQVTPVVTNRPGELRGHILTHDGKSIILARQDGAGGGWRITVRDFEGETEKELYHAAKEQFYAFGISPDGKQLAILSRALEAKILEVYIRVGPTSGGELKELCRPDKVARQLTWTADGSRILFCRQQPSSEKWGLWRVAAEGGVPEDLHSEMIGEMIHLTAHPNGKWIAFSAQGSIRNAELWAIENIHQELGTKQR